MALQDFVGHIWPLASGDRRTSDDGRRREKSLWRFHRDAGSETGRQPPPSGRMSRAHMPRHAFIAVAAGWVVVIATLLATLLAIRWFG